jgi:hypothetical protein
MLVQRVPLHALRVARLNDDRSSLMLGIGTGRELGNAVVPQCAEVIGRVILSRVRFRTRGESEEEPGSGS